MNLKKVEIYGFKSFADKVEIKFENGVTGIVGPNGCGKSNVSDAIKWVLGEQSPKSLRGSSMADVIFSGTQSRKALSYCEVSLFFDNSNQMFSLAYDEVVITRKLFRSGESEYYINKQPARLRDIVNLLHECGIGKGGYTIIEQGRVGAIMNAKPEDRRTIFEEATGIAKFKTQKNESEKSLERTHDNIVRLNDIIAVIEEQLGPLERQAEKAKEFNELSAQLKYHELNTYVAKVEGVATEKGKINVRIQGIDEAGALKQDEHEKAQKAYDEVFGQITEADEKLKNYNEELLEKRVGMEKSSGEMKVLDARISFFKEQILNAEKSIEKNKTEQENAKATIDANKETLQGAEADLNKLLVRADKVSKELLKVSEKIALGEELEDKTRKQFIASIESLGNINLSKGTMSIERNNLVEKLTELTNKLNELNSRRDTVFQDKEKCDSIIDELDRSVNELKKSITDKEDEVRGGNEKVSEIENKIYGLASAVSALVARDNFYKELKENYDGYMPVVKQLLTRAKTNTELSKRIKGVVAELISNDKKYDVALETALAAAAQNVVTGTPDDARYLIEYLRANDLGRLTFLPITSVKPRPACFEAQSALNEVGALGLADELVKYNSEYEPVISNLLGNTLIVDNSANATKIAVKYNFLFRIVTLEGDVLSNQGALTGGSRRQNAVGLLSHDRKMQENAEALKEKRAELDRLKTEKEAESERTGALIDNLSALNDAYNQKRQNIALEREKQGVYERSLSELGREIESTTELIETLGVKLSDLDESFAKVSTGSKKLEEDRESAKVGADKQKAETEELGRERDRLTQENSELQVKLTEMRSYINSLGEENGRLLALITTLDNETNRLVNNNKNAEDIIKSLEKSKEKTALTKEEQDYINGIRAKISGIEEDKKQLKDKLEQSDALRQSTLEELTELLKKRQVEEIALAKIDSDLEHMQQSILEDYNETYETAVLVREEGYDAKKGEAEINRLRRRRSSLGAINATAIEESKALKERYEDMVVQRDDLEKAEKDLQVAIDKIRGEMLTQFDAGFAVINENFKRIFKELFGGGRAELQLDYENSTDKLEAGVEIVAEPPGKKLQKLSLLSGGEQALTAIAILFSILKLRPMPFCVLDEIEAPLDEANIDRFANYLLNFSKETQFIVITHKKATMERADALFGVTMQEKGVSKLVSVKLADVENIKDMAN